MKFFGDCLESLRVPFRIVAFKVDLRQDTGGNGSLYDVRAFWVEVEPVVFVCFDPYTARDTGGTEGADGARDDTTQSQPHCKAMVRTGSRLPVTQWDDVSR